MQVDLRPYEIEALRQIVINVRALANVVIKDDDHQRRLLNWVQMIEDMLERKSESPRQIVAEEWGKAVEEYELRPGSVTETIVARIVSRLDGLA